MPKSAKGWLLFSAATVAVVAVVFRVKMLRTTITGLA